MRPVVALLLLVACSSKSSTKPAPEPVASAGEDAAAPALIDAAATITLTRPPPLPPLPRGLPKLRDVDYNPATPEKHDLGAVLFFDSRLSRDGSMTCASCHVPSNGFAGAEPLALTLDGHRNLRHAPTLLNAGYHRALFQDGRADSLEAAIEANWAGQMGADPDRVADTLARHPMYAALFERAFAEPPTGRHIVEALAVYVRYLRSGDAPWDRHEAGLPGAGVDDIAIAGARVFNGRAQCAQCHPPPLYTDLGFHVAATSGDVGRARVTGLPADQYSFRTPTLRGAATRTPYLHDGSVSELGALLDAHLIQMTTTPGQPPMVLSREERTQLLTFLLALSPDATPFEKPRTIR
ncbi:MAG TPA: cytochrome c peroxidase [Kofleriaceae bacterium]|nr:cytochrome c peroxidase [Kofleriaceae bacterium]